MVVAEDGDVVFAARRDGYVSAQVQTTVIKVSCHDNRVAAYGRNEIRAWCKILGGEEIRQTEHHNQPSEFRGPYGSDSASPS